MVFIQSNKEKTLPHHFDCACAMYGAFDCGVDHRFITYEELENADQSLIILLKRNLVVGSVEFMELLFKTIGLPYIPRVKINSNREHLKMTLSEAIKLSSNSEIFIKPVKIKLFTGFVLDKWNVSSVSSYDPNTMVMVYKVIDIKSEFRCYISDNTVLGIKDYSGDSFNYPFDHQYIKDQVKINSELGFPKAYTMDIGILSDKSSTVIEYNDFWSIGNYGLENDRYYRTLKVRYNEILEELRTSQKLKI